MFWISPPAQRVPPRSVPRCRQPLARGSETPTPQLSRALVPATGKAQGSVRATVPYFRGVRPPAEPKRKPSGSYKAVPWPEEGRHLGWRSTARASLGTESTGWRTKDWGRGALPSWSSVPRRETFQLSSPTHLSKAIRHDLFMFPLLTASRYSESNFTGSKLSHQLSKQKTLPDCCPTSTPAYKSFLNKTAQNKQKCNSNVYTTLWGDDLSKALELSPGDLRLF